MTYKPVNKARVALITAATTLLGFGAYQGIGEYNKTPEQKAAEKELQATKKQLGLERDKIGEAPADYMSAALLDAVNSNSYDEAVTVPALVNEIKTKFNTANVKIASGEAAGCICGGVDGAKVVVIDRLGKTESYTR